MIIACKCAKDIRTPQVSLNFAPRWVCLEYLCKMYLPFYPHKQDKPRFKAKAPMDRSEQNVPIANLLAYILQKDIWKTGSYYSIISNTVERKIHFKSLKSIGGPALSCQGYFSVCMKQVGESTHLYLCATLITSVLCISPLSQLSTELRSWLLRILQKWQDKFAVQAQCNFHSTRWLDLKSRQAKTLFLNK